MNKYIYSLITFFTILFCGCDENKQEFTLVGKIQGLNSDTIIAYYQTPDFKLDTIVAINEEFKYTFTPDTFTIFTLFLKNGNELPIFADKGQSVEIKGTIDDPIIKGTSENKLLAQILENLKEIPENLIKQKVDSIIRTNNQSYTNLYLIDKYFVKDQQTDNQTIVDLINSQMGFIKDTPYMNDIQKRLKRQSSRYINTLSNRNKEGKLFRWPTLKNKYILIDFWASWNPESVAEQDSLERVIKALRKENFVIVSISLDYDKQAWMKASDRDTTQWIQLCDFKGWKNTTVEEQNIQSLPSNILLTPNKQIIERNIRGQKLIDKIKQLTKDDKRK